jgi:hypothetical protein
MAENDKMENNFQNDTYHSCYHLLNILCTIFDHFHFFPENATHSVRTEKGNLSQEMTFSQRRQRVCLIPSPHRYVPCPYLTTYHICIILAEASTDYYSELHPM